MEANIFSGYHFASNVVFKTGMNLSGIPIGLDLSYIVYGLKNEKFSEVYAKPRIALNTRYIQLNNVDTFGYCMGIYPSIQFNLVQKNKWQVGINYGYGVNFNTKGYNHETNFDNRAINSVINFAVDLGLKSSYCLNQKTQLTLGTGLYHVSNGNLKMFNGGINIIYGNLGIAYFPNSIPKNWNSKSNYKLESTRKFGYSISGFLAYRNLNYFASNQHYWVQGISQSFYLPITKIFNTGVGFDFFIDPTHKLNYTDSLKVSKIGLNERINFALGWYSTVKVARFFLPFGVYHYVYPLKYIKDPVYIRFGLGYQINKRQYCGLFFKGTINSKKQLQSDFMEWSWGVRF
ncbi:MAG: acyloxyacyl hydrolase [Bacteroidia bacterium]|nr:acyloxyacyl hydrolase [Bacteroidia bacterium]MCF8426052.1 acyloxyacyl hydrolase [Bacteroidia bacterium]MCF8445353.1 acyloxyacyl hydrolase [Bacteroidia bacterium]